MRTFLTRSGFFSKASVHSFAEMNRSALWILLGFLGFCTAGFVVLGLFEGSGPLTGWRQSPGFTREHIQDERDTGCSP